MFDPYWFTFSKLSQAQKIAVVLGAKLESSYEGGWWPSQDILPDHNTIFRIAPADSHLFFEAIQFLDSRSNKGIHNATS